MEFLHRHHPDSSFAAQGGQPHHRKTRRAGKEGAGRTQGGIHRGQAGFLRAVGHAGAEEILRPRTVQGRRGPHPQHSLRPGHRRDRGARGDRDVERVKSFPSGAQIEGPPPRKTVEYGTGIVVSDDGAIIAGREVIDGCLAIAIAGYGNADRVAEDKDHGVALLRIYGAHGLKPLALSNGAAKAGVELTGIADPQSQSGGAAVSSVRASVGQVGNGNDFALSPAPAVGFSGAAALDSESKFAGVALLKQVMVAGPPNAATPAQAALVPADTVRVFLKANGINGSDGSFDAKAAVVRVICVRK